MITCTIQYKQRKAVANLRHVVVDGLLIKDNQIILVKRGPEWSEPGKWALPGGYLNQNETVKQGVLRELLEETGYQAKIIKLIDYFDDPNRRHDIAQNISFSFQLEPIKKIKNHDSEVIKTQWFDLNKLPKESDFAFDHFKIIKKFLSR